MKANHFSLLCVALFGLPFILGCDAIDSIGDNAAQRPIAGAHVPVDIQDQQTQAQQKPQQPAPPQQTNPVAQTPPDPNTIRQLDTPQESDPTLDKAQAGVGKQGQGYGGGLITEPVHQYFTARDRITFEIQIPKQLQTWKAMNNNRNPKDVEEYKREIINPCGIELPELPPGREYIYDPKTGELLVGWHAQ